MRDDLFGDKELGELFGGGGVRTKEGRRGHVLGILHVLEHIVVVEAPCEIGRVDGLRVGGLDDRRVEPRGLLRLREDSGGSVEVDTGEERSCLRLRWRLRRRIEQRLGLKLLLLLGLEH